MKMIEIMSCFLHFGIRLFFETFVMNLYSMSALDGARFS